MIKSTRGNKYNNRESMRSEAVNQSTKNDTISQDGNGTIAAYTISPKGSPNHNNVFTPNARSNYKASSFIKTKIIEEDPSTDPINTIDGMNLRGKTMKNLQTLMQNNRMKSPINNRRTLVGFEEMARCLTPTSS